MDDCVYTIIEKGDMFGIVDLIPNKLEQKTRNVRARRKFTAQVLSEYVECLVLFLDDFSKIKDNYPQIFEEIFITSMVRYSKILVFKARAENEA